MKAGKGWSVEQLNTVLYGLLKVLRVKTCVNSLFCCAQAAKKDSADVKCGATAFIVIVGPFFVVFTASARVVCSLFISFSSSIMSVC